MHGFSLLKHFFINDSAQGITEYGAILAFVALIAATVFAFKGSLALALQNAFSSITTQLNSLATGTSS